MFVCRMQTIEINSTNYLNPYQFKYELPNNICTGKRKAYLARLSLPCSMYNVYDNISVILNEGGGNITLSIASGNYNTTQLINAVETELNIKSTYTYTVEKSLITNKITITNATTDFSLTVVKGDFIQLFGFNPGVKTSTSHILISDRQYNLVKNSVIFMRLSIFRNIRYKDIDYTFMIPLSESNQKILDKNVDTTDLKEQILCLKESICNNIEVEIYDEDGKLFKDFNVNFSLLINLI